MRAFAVSYFKRYRMEIALAGLPEPVWRTGYQAIAWRPELIDQHAEVLCQCFAQEIDAAVFPCLTQVSSCRGLMFEITRRPSFIPEATWLVLGPEGYCGTVQAMRERGVQGAIQNLGIIPSARGLGLGKALLLQALHGMYASGLGRGVLEVTAHNTAAVRLYDRVGFRRSRVVYKAVSPPWRMARDSVADAEPFPAVDRPELFL
jgi:GNAT superfamily N-acetyltransferase